MENTLLNLIPAAYLPEIHLSQYDVGRTITFTLKDGASDYSVPSGASVKVKATKPSGFGFEVACTFNGGTVTLVTTDTMTPENGRFPAELSIVSGNTTIGTSNFIFNIERSPHPEGTIDGDAETIIPELTLLVERIEAAADSVDEDTQIVTEAKAEVLQAKADTLQAKADTLSARDESVSAKDLAVSSAQTSVEASERAEELVGSVETKADAIVKSASGEVASFTDGGNGLLVKTLNVNIVPKQSGSGDPSPSNVRPISGYSEVVTSRVGKNLCNLVYGNRVPSVSTGQMVSANGWSTEFIKVDTSKDYVLSLVGNISRYVLFYDKNQAYISGLADFTDGDRLNNYSSWANVGYIKLRTDEVENASPKIQLEVGSTPTPYEPYQGTSYPISLGQTVYGGTLEVMSGKLTITHASIVLDGSQPVSINGVLPYGGVQAIITPTPAKAYGSPSAYSDILCDRFRPYAGEEMGIINGRTVNRNLYFNMPSTATTAALAREWFGNNPTTVVYKLATPTEITLTPTQVKTLLGNNNIFADSGSVEVEYRADTTLAYNELLSLIASLS